VFPDPVHVRQDTSQESQFLVVALLKYPDGQAEGQVLFVDK
jgi:hypothetical protein